MYWLRRLLLWFPGPRRSRVRNLEEEMQANLSLAIEDARQAGLPADDAPRVARSEFGSLTRAHEEARFVWFPGWDGLSQDVRFAWRTLMRAPVFTLVAILSLALGIGAATAIFSLVDTVVLKPLTYRDPGRLVLVREVVPPLEHIYPTMPVNLQHFRFWRQEAGSFAGLAAAISGNATLESGGDPEVIGGAEVAANLFALLGVQPQLGRAFLPEEEQPNGSSVVIITDGLWRRRFAASPSIVGQNIRLGGAQSLVVGVLPASFRFPRKDDLGPLTRLPERAEFFAPLRETAPGWGGDFDYIVFGRLRPDISLAQGAAELNLLEKRIAREHQLPAGLHVQMRRLQEVIGSPARTGLVVLFAAVLLLVLIVCVNLANLLLARGSARAREFSLRIALGASRVRLLRAALVETIMLSCAGAVLGVAAAQAALLWFVRTLPVDLPRLDEVRMDGRLLTFALGLSLVCGWLCGLLPALRLSHADPQIALRGESHTATGSRRGLRLRECLVGAEVALGTLLLVLAGLLFSSLWHVLHVNRGFTGGETLDIALNLPPSYRKVQDRAAFFDRAAERLRALPGVSAVAAINRVPLSGESNVNDVETEGSDQGALDPATRHLVMVNVRFISQDYFRTMGIPLIEGRAIEAADRERDVAVVSERLAAKLWPGQRPVGKVLSSGSGVNRAQVVGVVGDVHSTRLERDPTLMIYIPFWKQAYQVADLAVRSAPGMRTLPQEVRRTLRDIDATIPAPKMRTMGELVSEAVAQRRFQMQVAAAFAVSALLLAALGIYGVVAYGIGLRRREFGIRKALGASPFQLRRMVVWKGLRPVILGLAGGMLAALAAGNIVRTLLFGVAPADGWTLASVAAVLLGVATLACLIPAGTAMRIDPARVLREE
jgi:predicted permease